VVAIENGISALVEAQEIIATFHLMIHKKVQARFEIWIAKAKDSLIGSFANGIGRDQAALLAPILLP